MFATPDETSGTTAQILLNLFLAYGFPVRLLSDRGSNFLSALVEELLRLLRVASVTTTSYHPQTDGKNEVSHRMLLSQIRAFVSKDNRADWDSLLPFFAFAANSTPSDGMEFSPFYLFYGRQPRSPHEVAFASDSLRGILESAPPAAQLTAFTRQVRERLASAKKTPR